MTDPTFQVITPPPAPRYTVYASKLETDDVLQVGDLFGNGPQGWLPIDPALYGFQIGAGDPTTYVRPPARNTSVETTPPAILA